MIWIYDDKAGRWKPVTEHLRERAEEAQSRYEAEDAALPDLVQDVEVRLGFANRSVSSPLF